MRKGGKDRGRRRERVKRKGWIEEGGGRESEEERMDRGRRSEEESRKGVKRKGRREGKGRAPRVIQTAPGEDLVKSRFN